MTLTRVREIQNSGSTATATLAGAPTQNNLLVAFCSAGPTAMSAAGTWTKILEITAGNADIAAMFWKIAGAGESAAQTPFTYTTGANNVLIVAEYSTTNGWDVTQPEVSTANADADATKTTTGSCDPTDGVERLVIGCAFSDGASTFATQKISGSTTSVNEVGDIAAGAATTGNTITLFELLVASTASGNYTAEAVAGRTDDGSAHIAIFKPAAAAASTAPPPFSRPTRVWTRRR